MTDQSMTSESQVSTETAVETDDDSGDSDDDDTGFTLQDVDRCYFGPDAMQDAQEYLAKVTALDPAPNIQMNWDTEKDQVQDGFGIAVVPISKRTEGKGNVVIGVAVAQIPDPATIAKHEKGQEFISSLITDVCIAKVANSVRPRSDGTTAGSMPKSLEDFIESRRGRESLKAFTETANVFVKALRKKGLKMMTAPLLRQILQSKQFADNMPIPHTEGLWERVGEKMIALAESKKLDASVIRNWLETRDQVEISAVEELDVDALDDLV